ncbi:acyltransferase family protein [Lentilactobacillus sp. SPB1-3]|uniref:Acyltransferase family protein n=1 Tax=Lentilactobacillus terminaliae TaxID=3003483 RepID=A0ACD5DF70_9LACO|nr:acyltransferase family protein [Lentilactobacillus sp. SPB1-3]MCZ0976552.1 acyltransferase family protein [Lentilactobacillus sp. SPB1-3]
MTKKRIEWIDIAKAFGIIAVVWGHALVSGTTSQIIYWWHMPFFFILAGFFLKPIDSTKWKSFFNKKIKLDLIIYFMTGIIMILLYGLIHEKNLQYLIDTLPNLLIGGRTLNNYTTTFWFINVYLLSITVVTVLITVVKPRLLQLTIVTAGILLGASYGQIPVQIQGFTMLPWNLDGVLIATFYTYIGYLFFHTNWRWIQNPFASAGLIGMSVALITLRLTTDLRFKFSMKSHLIESSFPKFNGLLIIFVPLILSFSVIAIAVMITKIPQTIIMPFIGQHTMIIMYLHKVVLDLCNLANVDNLIIKVVIAIIVPLMIASALNVHRQQHPYLQIT